MDLGSGMGILYRCVGGLGTSIGIGVIVNPSPLLLFRDICAGVQGYQSYPCQDNFIL